MAFQRYVLLDGKKYPVVDTGPGSFQPIYDRQKTYDIGMTGKTIIQDFTVEERVPQEWKMTLRVFQYDPWPDDSYGVFSDLLAAVYEPFVDFVEHDDTKTHQVGISNPIIRIPRVGANLEGHCNGIDFIEVTLVKVFQ